MAILPVFFPVVDLGFKFYTAASLRTINYTIFEVKTLLVIKMMR